MIQSSTNAKCCTYHNVHEHKYADEGAEICSKISLPIFQVGVQEIIP